MILSASLSLTPKWMEKDWAGEGLKPLPQLQLKPFP